MTDAGRGQVVDLEEEIRNVQSALVSFTSGLRRNVAIIGDPFSGKSTLLREVSDRYGGTIKTVKLSKTIEAVDGMLPDAGPDHILAIDDCQFLYKRKIGGFGGLEKFLDRVAATGNLFITTWNRFSWNYLEQAFAMADYFPVTVNIPPLDASGVEAVVRSKFNLDQVSIRNGENQRKALPAVKWKSLKLGGLDLRIPAVWHWGKRIDDVLESSSGGTMRSVLEKLADESRGNPGVALAIWSRAYHDGAVNADEIELPEYDTDLDFDEAFVLSTILMTKRSTREDLLEALSDRLTVDKILYLLLNRRLIRVKDGAYGIDPLALHDVIKSLKKSRLVT